MSNDITICVRKRPCFRNIDVVSTTPTSISILNEKVKINLDKYNEIKTFDLGYTTYTPDFYLSETKEYIEIKGWVTDKDKAKFKGFTKKLTILYRKEMSPILGYVVKTYGKKYWELYEPKKT